MLRLLRTLNLIAGVLLVAMLVASFAFDGSFEEFFARQPPRIGPEWLLPILRSWLVLTLPAVGAAHVIIARLLEILDSVRRDDAFAPESALRLTTIAWCMFALQVLGAAGWPMTAGMNAAGSDLHWSFSMTGWVVTGLLFALARIFRDGARIRADLARMI